MSQPRKPTRSEAVAMLRNEQRNKEHLGFTLTCQALLAEAGGPLGIRDFAIRLRHRNADDMYLVLSAFDGHKDSTLHATRDAERQWWASGFGDLVLEVLHAAVVSGVAVVTGKIAGRADKTVTLDPTHLSGGRLDVDKGSLTVDEGGVIEVFTRLSVTATETTSLDEAPPVIPRNTKPIAKQSPPIVVRPRRSRGWGEVAGRAEALHTVLRKYPQYAVPMRVVGKKGKRRAVTSDHATCHFLHVKMTQSDLWRLLPDDVRAMFSSEKTFKQDVWGPSGQAQEGHRVSLKDQDILTKLFKGFKRKEMNREVIHIGGGVVGEKRSKLYPRLYWGDLRDGRSED